jgi:nitrate/nitrite transporter NarK
MMPPVYCVFYYVASYARDELGMPYTESLNLVIILNGVGLPARVLPGFIADRFIGVLNVQAIALVFNVIMLWTWLSVNSIASYYVWVVFYGLGAGAFQSLFTFGHWRLQPGHHEDWYKAGYGLHSHWL